MNSSKKHWENVYEHKQLAELSWYEQIPETSLNFISELSLPKDAAIIDIGGGNSMLADHLLASGYVNVTVLDISEKAIKNAQQRLGNKAGAINWIVADVLHFKPSQQYAVWHDRAAFHFLTSPADQDAYLDTVHRALSIDGYVLMSTFAIDGPVSCSGVPVQQYSQKSLAGLFDKYFINSGCIEKTHVTPANTIQKFIFCGFKKK